MWAQAVIDHGMEARGLLRRRRMAARGQPGMGCHAIVGGFPILPPEALRPTSRRWDVLLMRVRLPNRPGALGAVASALGLIGADINLVEIVEKRGDVEVDEFIFDLPSSQTVESLVAACDSLDKVQVEWVRNYPRGGGIEYDVELHRRMTAETPRAGEILASAAPLVFRAQWSLLLEVSPAPRVVFSTPGAPDVDTDTIRRFHPFDTIHRVVLEPGWFPGWEAHHAAVVPIAEQRVVVVARRGDPAFFRSELVRLAHLVGATDIADISDQPVTTADLDLAHRRPVAAPLYTRESL